MEAAPRGVPVLHAAARRLALAAFLGLTGAAAAPPPASACGGLFCGQAPVDQRAERIVFLHRESGTRMIVQISYAGGSEDFAWVLPVAFVPARSDLGTFPAQAIAALDRLTAPLFVRPDEEGCWDVKLNGGGGPESTPGVTVHLEETVGPYDIVVIEGTDPAELVAWLRENRYRVTDPMIPVIAQYTSEGMKLLALKLHPNAGTQDIEPFRIDFPPSLPSIPLRLTAVAAEPQMSLLVFVVAAERFGPANWSELELDPASIRFAAHSLPAETTYQSLVSREADAAGGRGFVTELATSTAPLVETVRASAVRDEEQRAARDALVALLEGNAHLTRLYTLVSPEEMTLDPIFRPAPGPDVSGVVTMSRFVGGDDLCGFAAVTQGCHYDLCGAGACAEVEAEGLPALAGCVCPEGTSARPVPYPGASWGSVTCQDVATSHLMPGDRATPEEAPLPDPCDGAECGLGTCVPINLRVTCRCDPGAVAIGWRGAFTGALRVSCVDPSRRVPASVFAEERPRPSDDGGPGRRPDAGGVLEMDAGSGPGLRPGGGGCAVRAGSGGVAPLLLGALAFSCLVRRRRR